MENEPYRTLRTTMSPSSGASRSSIRQAVSSWCSVFASETALKDALVPGTAAQDP
ncbi:hypothetical protein ACFXP3_35200 [Streptomyces sp. NPDC059096]|uniref:hypothetical protein n=1 Tax=Streptomyces sp. NPDC059096 TaxID=3346727 RepID=UPI0036B18417